MLRPLPRSIFFRLLQAAVQMGHTRFARQASLSWLAAYPGDLPISLFYAQILDLEGHPEQALPVLVHLCQIDPEYVEATRARLKAETSLQAQQAIHSKGKRQSVRGRRAERNEALTWTQALGAEVASKSQVKEKSVLQEATVTTWSQSVYLARKYLEESQKGSQTTSDLEKAETALHPALAYGLSNPLVGVTHLEILRASGTPYQSLRDLADYYHQHWPDCLQFQLLLAEALMESGLADEAVVLLHQVAARDLIGQVATRLWGETHPFRALWPNLLELKLDIPIPASVAAALGWNQLPYGEAPIEQQHPIKPEKAQQQAIPKGFSEVPQPIKEQPLSVEPIQEPEASPRPIFSAIPETLRSVQAELERVAERLHQPELARADGRFPVYVVMTTRHGLAAQYGTQSAAIHTELQSLVQAVQARRDWRARLFYADEGIPPDVRAARPLDPWSLKLSLADLDTYLGRKGEMIGAVLIVGGPEVVPFHRLPNPVDDADDDVPSDNPYATRDENYFVPEWPVGRLPGGASKDPEALIALLKSLTARHTTSAGRRQPVKNNWLATLLDWLLLWAGLAAPSKHKHPSFGYTAAVWRRASQMVFRPIGEAAALRISPPLCASGQPTLPLPSGRLAYFNLHGLVDAVEWYGQSESVTGEGGPAGACENSGDYPVALRPQDIINSGHAPVVVFSEACYGANILGKTVDEALALKFLQAGSQAVTGSTCTAYGSINTPLTAADFLGHAFWNALKQGSPAGEALRRAKVSLAREMHRRQGYLDGEDQKTLISFVLYGDPLAQPLGQVRQPKGAFRPAVMRSVKPPHGVKTVCDRARQEDMDNPVPADVVEYVKSVVEQYLPGMEGAQVAWRHEHTDCIMNGHECPTGQLQLKSVGKSASVMIGSEQSSPTVPVNPRDADPQRRIVILSKEVSGETHVHHHYARITLDEQNRLVKLVVSR